MRRLREYVLWHLHNTSLCEAKIAELCISPFIRSQRTITYYDRMIAKKKTLPSLLHGSRDEDSILTNREKYSYDLSIVTSTVHSW